MAMLLPLTFLRVESQEITVISASFSSTTAALTIMDVEFSQATDMEVQIDKGAGYISIVNGGSVVTPHAYNVSNQTTLLHSTVYPIRFRPLGQINWTTITLTTDTETVVVPADWTAVQAATRYDETKPMAGMFVGGAPNAGVFGASNSQVGRHQSVRFRAPRTGNLLLFSVENRINAVSSNFTRTSTPEYEEGRDYFASQGVVLTNVDTQANREIANRIAWMLGNPYSAGNCGTKVFEIRNDINGLPDMSVAPLGTTAGTPFVGINNSFDFYDHTFDVPTPVTAGVFYHCVVLNLTPPAASQTQLSGLSAVDAFNMPTNVGVYGLNGVEHSDGPYPADQDGPFFAGHRVLRSQDFANPTSWSVDSNTIGWWLAKYTTGESIGFTAASNDTHIINDLTGKSASMYIEGSRRARQSLKASHDTVVDGIWLQHGHRYQSSGQPMLVQFKDALTNSVLATASIPHDAAVDNAANGPDFFDPMSNVWSYQPFNVNVPITGATDYYVELSSPTSAGFVIMCSSKSKNETIPEYMQNGIYGGAQRSEDAGATWGIFTGSGSSAPDHRALKLLLTVEGMPRSLTG